MDTIPTIALVSLIIGVICYYLLALNERKEIMARESYKTLSVISFLFFMTGSILCMLARKWK